MRTSCIALVLASSVWCLAAEGAGDPEAVKSVLSGKQTVARASWWGFDEVEATEALQSAINSGAKKIIVEDLGSPWIVDKIQLASNQEVVFEKGVVVLAKKSAFKGTGDSLFTAWLKKNVTLTGHGATLRMRKSDYQSDAYKRAEWRHCLNIRSCTNVRVCGLTLAESGGDGIYLGVAKGGVTNKNVVINDVVCDANHRQGISVISAEDLLIEDTVLKNTSGTAPQAGIDFEPNRPNEKIVNCVMRNCVAENNRGCAYVLYLKPLDGTSADVSVRIENCVSRGANAVSAVVVTSNSGPSGPVKGLIEFVNCRFEDTGRAGIGIRDVPVTGCRVRFENCTIADPAESPSPVAPIVFGARRGCREHIGGVELANCTIKERVERPLMKFRDYAGGLKVLDVTGRLTVVKDGKERTIPITDQLLDELMPSRTFKTIEPYKTASLRFKPLVADIAPAALKLSPVWLRDSATYLLYAQKGEAVTFSIRYAPVGRYSGKPMPMRIVSPSGTTVKTVEAAFREETAGTFDAAETGAYKLLCRSKPNRAAMVSTTHRLCVCAEDEPIHFIGTVGELFFHVPAGVKEFGVKVWGQGAEMVKVALFDPTGKKAWEHDNVSEPQMFAGKPDDPSQGRTWCVRLDRPSKGHFEDCAVELLGIPQVLACTREALLVPAE